MSKPTTKTTTTTEPLIIPDERLQRFLEALLRLEIKYWAGMPSAKEEVKP